MSPPNCAAGAAAFFRRAVRHCAVLYTCCLLCVVPPTAQASLLLTNLSPTITGTPSLSARVGYVYSFTPTASDPEGSTLRFTISGKPAWATFDSTTGRLRGTPSSGYIGRTGTIVIGVTDGALYRYLPGFTILVSSTAVVGKATLYWKAPLKTTSGATLTGLAGYRVYYGKSSTSLTNRVSVPYPSVTSAVIQSLDGGRWYFAITAYTSSGKESSKSAIVSKYIG